MKKKINLISNKDIKEYQMIPIDAQILDTSALKQKNNTIKCIYIPICTVTKRTDINTLYRE